MNLGCPLNLSTAGAHSISRQHAKLLLAAITIAIAIIITISITVCPAICVGEAAHLTTSPQARSKEQSLLAKNLRKALFDLRKKQVHIDTHTHTTNVNTQILTPYYSKSRTQIHIHTHTHTHTHIDRLRGEMHRL
jgi:hypothetical protein